MYIYQKTHLKKIKSNGNYENYDIRNLKIKDIFDGFLDGYIELKHSALSGTFFLTLENLRAMQLPMNVNSTLNTWLSSLGNKELPVTREINVYDTGTVKYSDAILAGFKVSRIGRLMPVNATVSNADRVDLWLYKNAKDKQTIFKRMLVTVNGYLHRTYIHEEGVAVYGGGTTFNICKINNVGVLSFAECGDIRQYKINTENVFNTTLTTPLHNEVMIKLNQDISGKSVIPVVMGRPLLDKSTFEVIDAKSGTIKIKTRKLNVINMIFDSAYDLNLESLGVFLNTSQGVYSKVRMEELESDICMRNLFLLPQTFIVTVDVDDIAYETRALHDVGLTSVYEYHEEPIYPIITSRGRLPEYWKRVLMDQWIINITNDLTKRRLYQTNLEQNNIAINGAMPTWKWYLDKPEILVITTSKKTEDKTKESNNNPTKKVTPDVTTPTIVLNPADFVIEWKDDRDGTNTITAMGEVQDAYFTIVNNSKVTGLTTTIQLVDQNDIPLEPESGRLDGALSKGANHMFRWNYGDEYGIRDITKVIAKVTIAHKTTTLKFERELLLTNTSVWGLEFFWSNVNNNGPDIKVTNRAAEKIHLIAQLPVRFQTADYSFAGWVDVGNQRIIIPMTGNNLIGNKFQTIYTLPKDKLSKAPINKMITASVGLFLGNKLIDRQEATVMVE